jgi:PAS domain S-box-containing protein
MAKVNKPKTHEHKIKEPPKETAAEVIKEIAKAEGILSAIGDGISILDRTFKVLYQNQVEKEMMGIHVGEFCYKAYAKKQGICGGCPIALTFKDGILHTVQRELQTDKGIRYAEITASPLKDSTGKIIAGIEVVRDITERKQADIALQYSEERYRSTIDFLDDAIHVADKDLTIILVNKKLIEWHQRFRLEKDAIGKNVFQVYAFLPNSVREEYESIFKTGAPITTEESIHIQGEEVITETKKIPIFEGSNVTKVITIIRDITERKKVEEEMKRGRAELKERIKELEEFYDMAVGRELRMVELKKEIEQLKEQLDEYGINPEN